MQAQTGALCRSSSALKESREDEEETSLRMSHSPAMVLLLVDTSAVMLAKSAQVTDIFPEGGMDGK